MPHLNEFTAGASCSVIWGASSSPSAGQKGIFLTEAHRDRT